MGGLYGRPFWVSTAEDDESDIFRLPRPGLPARSAGRIYSTRARRMSSGEEPAGVQGSKPAGPTLWITFRSSPRGRQALGPPPFRALRPSFAALSPHQGKSAERLTRAYVRGTPFGLGARVS